MVSHKKLSGIEITLGKSGLRFKKRPSAYNICIAKEMEGTQGPKLGRYDKEFQEKFSQVAKKCASMV